MALMICIISGCEEKGCTNSSSFNYNAEATQNDGSCLEMFGCLGYNTGYSNSGQKGLSLGNPYYDQKMIEEIGLQQSFFNGVPASVYILYEPSIEYRNAYANQNGEILFGYHMFYYTISNFNELAAAGILAHEWGHRVQFTAGWNTTMQNPHLELEADAFSGYYMALGKAWAWSQIEGYYASTYATGDYNFNHPTHHGTPNQRLAAAYLGVQTAIDAVNSNKNYTYNELHQLFITAISNDILINIKGKSGESSIYRRIANGSAKGKNNNILDHIPFDQRKKLFPKL